MIKPAFIVTLLCLPNEDFGKRNRRSGVCLRGTLRGCEYSIWATNHRRVPRKHTPDPLFHFPKSSFGEHSFCSKCSPQWGRLSNKWGGVAHDCPTLHYRQVGWTRALHRTDARRWVVDIVANKKVALSGLGRNGYEKRR